MNTLTSRLRKSIALFSVSALLSTLVVVSPASAAWYDSAVAKLGDPSYQTMSAEQKEALLSATSSRQDAAVVLHRALGGQAATITELPFTDKAEIAPYATAAVLYLYEEGVVQGNPDGTFKPTAMLNRAELVVMLDRAGLLGDDTAATTPAVDAEFVGVEWAKAAFQKAAKDGVVQGYPDGTWRPAGAVNKAETFVLANRATGGVDETPTNPDRPRDTSFDPRGNTQGSIESVEKGSRDETEALEGESDVEIYAVDVETDTDGPLELQSVDLHFGEGTAGDASTKPWDYFEEVSLAVEGKVVATADAGSASDWSDKITSGSSFDELNDADADVASVYRLRFTGLEEVLPADETTKLSVLVTVKDALDSDDETAQWHLLFTQFRVMDESGLVTNYNDDLTSDVAESFNMNEADEAQLEIRVAPEEIDGTVVEVNKSSDTNGVEIYKFVIEEDNGVGADIEEMVLKFTTNDPTVANEAQKGDQENNVIKRAYIYQDGKKVGDETMSSNGTVTFDNLGIRVDGDTTEEFSVVVDLEDTNQAARYAEGTTLNVEIDAILEATDDNGNDEDDLTFAGEGVTSETHELRTEGMRVALVSAPAPSVTVRSTGSTPASDTAVFQLQFEVTAFGSDVYVDKELQHNLTVQGDGLRYSIQGTAGTPVASGAVISASGNADELTHTFRVRKDKTATFTMTVTGTPSVDAAARLVLNGIDYKVASTDLAGDIDATDAVYTFEMGANGDFKTPYSSTLTFVN